MQHTDIFRVHKSLLKVWGLKGPWIQVEVRECTGHLSDVMSSDISV